MKIVISPAGQNRFKYFSANGGAGFTPGSCEANCMPTDCSWEVLTGGQNDSSSRAYLSKRQEDPV